jgi:glycosyltransferase involved in cell wall biosynthesis
MKIFLVGNTAWSMYNFRLEVIRTLIAHHHDVTVLAPTDAWSEKLVAEGIPYIPVEMDNKGTSPGKDLGLYRRLYRLYKQHRPDLIFHYTIKPNIFGSLAAAACGIQSIACVTGAGTVFIKHSWVTRVVRGLLRIALRFPRQVWFLNADDRNLFASYGLVKKNKIRLLPGEGIDTGKFSVERKVDSHGPMTFLYLGRLLWDKGIGEYVEAARQIKKDHPQVVFRMLGFLDAQNPSAVPRSAIEEWSREGLIEYLGVTDEVSSVIREADCVVLPSYREGIPRSILEASAMGKPVIATDVPGCREVVEHAVTGYLCQPRSATDLRQSMERMIAMNEERRRAMGSAGRQKMADTFDIRRIITYYLEVIPSPGSSPVVAES